MQKLKAENHQKAKNCWKAERKKKLNVVNVEENVNVEHSGRGKRDDKLHKGKLFLDY